MKTTLDYIEDAKRTLGIQSDYALAQWLGITRAAVSSYKLKRTIIDDYAAIRIAEVLGVPPLQIIATANAEREKDEKRRGFWERVAQSATVGILAMSVIGPSLREVRADPTFSTSEYRLCALGRRSRRWASAHP